MATKPLIMSNGFIYYACGQMMYALNTTLVSANVEWKQQLPGMIISPPILQGSDLYYATSDPTILYRSGLTSNATITTYPVGPMGRLAGLVMSER